MEEKRLFLESLSLSSLSADDPAEKKKNGPNSSSSSTRELLTSTLFWIGFGLFGWYFPRSLVHRETSILSLEPPYQMGGGGAVIVDFELNQPLVDPPTVDNLLLRSTSVVFPLIFIVLHAWYSNIPTLYTNSGSSSPNRIATKVQKIHRVATVISAFSAAIGLSEGSTVMIKLWVRRRRPNFYALCGFDISNRKCMGTLEEIREANFSFPSGHSSLVCCGMTFLVWYLHGASYGINTIQRSGDKTKSKFGFGSPRFFSLMVCTCFPWGWALFVAASRLVDHWHHPSDVLAGLALGFATCTIVYHHWYAPIWSPNAGIPLSLLVVSNTNNDNRYGAKTNAGPQTVAGSSIALTAGTKSSSSMTTTTTTTTKRRPNGESTVSKTGLDP